MERSRFFKYMLVFVALLSILFGSRAAANVKKLTIMVYMCGGDLESQHGFASNDLMEMAKAGINTEKVSLLVMTGGARKWTAGNMENQTIIREIGDRKSRIVFKDEQKNMGSAETLTQLLKFGQERYPADKYALILWDHGGGPLEGVCWDEMFSMDCLTLNELKTGLREANLPQRLSWIGFDACLMGSLEVASVCAPYADYMIASQELEPGGGWDYTCFGEIDNDASGAETGRRIIDAFFAAAGEELRKGVPLTLSCTDLRKVNDLNEALNRLFADMTENLSDNSYVSYSMNRSSISSVARTSGREYDLADLRSLVKVFSETSCTDASNTMEMLDTAVVYQRSSVDGLNGLTIYAPFYNKAEYLETWGGLYNVVSSSVGYAEWTRKFGTILTGKLLTDWQLASIIHETDISPDAFSLQLTQDQMNHFLSAELLILSYYPGQGYVVSNRYGDLQPTSEGLLLAEIDHQCLYPIGKDGQILTWEVPFQEIDGSYVLQAQLRRAFLKNKDDWIRWANIRLWKNPETGWFEISDAVFIGDDPFVGRTEVDLSEWDSLYFVIYPARPVQNEYGNYLPFDRWDDRSISAEGREWIQYHVSLNKLAGFDFRPANSSAVQRYACFQIQDVQGGQFVSELIPIENQNAKILELSRTLVDNEKLKITLDQIRINRTQVEGGVSLYMTAENRMDKDVFVIIHDISANNVALTQYDSEDIGSISLVRAGEQIPIAWTMDASYLQYAGVQNISRIGLSFEVTDHDNLQDYYPVSIEVDLDFGDLEEPRQLNVLSSSETNGVLIDLFDWNVDTDGSLVFQVCLHNRSGRMISDRDCNLTGSINGYCFGSRAVLCPVNHYTSRSSDFLCEDGQDWYGTLRFNATLGYDAEISDEELPLALFYSSIDAMRIQNEDYFQAMGISQVREITLRFECKSENSVDVILPLMFHFPEPLCYAAVRGQDIPSMPDYPTVVDTSTAHIQLVSLQVVQDELIAVLIWQNLQDKEVEFPIMWGSDPGPVEINGITVKEIKCGQHNLSSIPSGESALVTFEYLTNTVPLPLSEIRLAVFTEGFFCDCIFEPPFTVRFDPMVTEAGRICDGFTVTPDKESMDQQVRDPLKK